MVEDDRLDIMTTCLANQALSKDADECNETPVRNQSSFTNDGAPLTRNMASSTSCFSRNSAKTPYANIFVLVDSSFVCNNSFEAGLTATYSQYCASQSRIMVSSTAT